MDFVLGLPETSRHNNAIWVIVDGLTKSAQFVPFRTGIKMHTMADMFIKEIVQLHGTPALIVSDRDSQFFSRFWVSFQQAMGT